MVLPRGVGRRFPSRMSIGVDWGFKTIPVKTILCRRRRGWIRVSEIGDGNGIILTNNGHPWWYQQTLQDILILIYSVHIMALSQSTTVLLVKGRRSQNISPDPSFPIFSRFAEYLARGTQMVPTSDLESAHFISNSGPTTCAGRSRHSIIRWTTSLLPLLHLVKMYSLEPILGCGTTC